jgi:hypothetical protein
MSAEVIPLPIRFDPNSPGAETRYDHVVQCINRLSAERHRNRRRSSELERQFVENDLVASSGKRRGQPLTEHGRRRRLGQLLSLYRDLRELDEERVRLHRALEAMNEAIDAWARETYGVGE